MTTVEILKAATDPKRGLSIAPELTALLEAAEEAAESLTTAHRTWHGVSTEESCVWAMCASLKRLRSLGFGGKV